MKLKLLFVILMVSAVSSVEEYPDRMITNLESVMGVDVDWECTAYAYVRCLNWVEEGFKDDFNECIHQQYEWFCGIK